MRRGVWPPGFQHGGRICGHIDPQAVAEVSELIAVVLNGNGNGRRADPEMALP